MIIVEADRGRALQENPQLRNVGHEEVGLVGICGRIETILHDLRVADEAVPIDIINRGPDWLFDRRIPRGARQIIYTL
jgi:hypothetical protein